MPNWKKVIVSGSDAVLNSLNATTALTASGLIYPTVDGTANQVIQTDGLGNLFFGSVDTIYELVKNVSGTTLYKGTPVHATGSGTSGNLVGIIAASASNPATMPATLVLNEDLADGDEGYAIISGLIQGVDTSTFESGQVVYVGENSGYTNIKPTGSNLIQNLGIVTKIHPSNGAGVVLGAGRSNDVPNLLNGEVFWGEGNRAIKKPLADILSGSSYTYSGSFSGSFQGDGSQLTGIIHYTDSDTLNYINSIRVISSSAQISTEISGAFALTSASLSLRTTNLENAGYTTCIGDITGVTAGTGLTGGGTSGTVTVSHADTSTLTGAQGTAGIASITVDDLGHVTAVTTATYCTTDTDTTYTANEMLTCIKTVDGAGSGLDADLLDGNQASAFYLATNPSGYTTCIGDITGVTAGTGLNGGGTTGTVTVNVNSDQRGSIVLIGQDTNDYIHVNTTVIDFRLDGNLDMRLENDGDLHVDGDVIAYSTTTSDIRFKDNINTIENSLSKIKAMRGVEFVWNAGGRKGEYDLGVIAQEVEKIVPTIVREKKLPMFDNSDTIYKTVDYEKLIPLLIESIKELSKNLEEANTKINDLHQILSNNGITE